MAAQDTHPAVVMVGIRAPLEVHQVPTAHPTGDEVLVRVEWTASTPLDLHQADGGLLVKHPQVSGDGVAGTVLEAGPDARHLKVGDRVFGFQWREQKEKGHQEKLTAPEWLFGKIPPGFSMEEAVTVPNNFVTACHTIATDLGLPMPWPKPAGYVPPRASDAILIWGAASSVGQYTLQVLRYYGYWNLLATASPAQHEKVKSLGASRVFDYRDPSVSATILKACSPPTGGPAVPLIVDCIGSKEGTLAPIVKLAQRGSRVAIMLPVIVKHATANSAPEYGLDVQAEAEWEEGVEARGVRTHFYLNNELFKEKLQLEIMPTLLARRDIVPNKYRVIEGKTMLDRAEKALAVLRSGTISGERLVWRISEQC